MTNERPIEDARCWLFNTADRDVDVHVNYHETPFATVRPEEDQPVFSVDSAANGTYGTYTFEARAPGDGTLFASVSVPLEEGDSYAVVFHQVGDAEYAMAAYESDFSPSASTRFEIRHTGRPEEIQWTLAPKAEADPRIPVDERSGTLERGQWQQALDVVENEYRLEILVDGEVVAFRQDLELEANRMIVVYLLDDPQPWYGSDQKEDHILRQEYQIQTGDAKADIVTDPADPFSTSDENEPIQFDCEDVELYHTNRVETIIEATDPDGIVTDLGIADVTPDADGFVMPDENVDPAFAIGGTTTATLLMKPKVSPGSYDVEIISNPDTLGEQVTCVVDVEVKPITVERLRDLVTSYHEDGEMTDAIANELLALLNAAEGYLNPAETSQVESLAQDILGLIEDFLGSDLRTSLEAELDALFEAAGIFPSEDPASACDSLKRVVKVVGENKEEGISVEATVDIETETKALREYLGCG